MKERDKKDRGGPPTGSRSGPRARAFQQRTYGDPYKRAERPERGGFSERLQAPVSIRLDADVARVFRDSESVNEALRLVMRLARLGSGRPPGPPRHRAPSSRDRTAPPRDRSGPPPVRTGPPRDRSGAPRDRPAGGRPPPRRPRFEE